MSLGGGETSSETPTINLNVKKGMGAPQSTYFDLRSLEHSFCLHTNVFLKMTTVIVSFFFREKKIRSFYKVYKLWILMLSGFFFVRLIFRFEMIQQYHLWNYTYSGYLSFFLYKNARNIQLQESELLRVFFFVPFFFRQGEIYFIVGVLLFFV